MFAPGCVWDRFGLFVLDFCAWRFAVGLVDFDSYLFAHVFLCPRVCYRRVFVVCFGCVWLLIVLIVWFIFVGNDLVVYCYLVIVFMCFWVGCCVDLLLVACS